MKEQRGSSSIFPHIRAVTIPALDPAPESDFNSFLGILAIPIPDLDAGKSGFETAAGGESSRNLGPTF